jgi:uncharacterized membrane protein YagU involved in acid resistance
MPTNFPQFPAISRGLWSGLMATSAMTFFLFYAHRRLPDARRRALPPAALTHEIQEGLAGDSTRPERRENRSLIAHFGFGSLAGLAYSLLPSSWKHKSAPAGAAFGLVVWGTSYLGWIPALGLSPAATKAPKGENLMMVLAHLVFGLALAGAEKNLAERGRKLLDGGVDGEKGREKREAA